MFLTRPVYPCRRVLSLPSFICSCLFVISFYSGIVCLGQNEISNKDKSKLCIKNDTSCAKQQVAFNVSEGACTMLYHSYTSSICYDENFRGDVDDSYSYGEVSLLTYLYKENLFHYPAFNITFSNIQWITMKMRFKENESSNVSFCREFQVSADIVPEFYFFYDCIWSHTYQNKPYIFQYQLTTRSSETYLYKYFFIVPDSDKMDEDATSISDWEVFSMVNISDSTSSLCLTVQAVPVSFNVSTYRIQVLYFKDEEIFNNAKRNRKDVSRLKQKNEVIRQLWDNTWVLHVKNIVHSPEIPYFTFSYDTQSRPGIYKFTVELVHSLCNGQCHVSETPSIVIVDLPARSTLVLFVGAVILIPICLTLYFIWRRKCEPTVSTPDSSLPSKFLLIYNPVSVDHINAMVALTRYLNRVCHLQAMIDVLGIPQSGHKDPLKWYTEAFKEAQYVGIFSSPKSNPTERETVMRSLIYSNTHVIAQSQLRMRLCTPGARSTFFSVSLPNGCWDTLPDEAQALKRYTLPRDLDPLLVLIGGVPQCDHGNGFQEALDEAKPEREALVLTLNNTAVTSAAPGPSAASSPTPTPVTCCAALSTSDPDLISTSQQVTSCMSTPASSDEQLSLLGDDCETQC